MSRVFLMSLALLSALELAATTQVVASPLEDNTLGNSVFSGITSPHPTSLGVNPAALGLGGSGNHFFAQTSARLSQITWDRQVVDPNSGELGDGPNASDLIASPGGFLAFYGSVADIGHLGISLSTPIWQRFGQAEEFAFHTSGGSFLQSRLTLAGALRVGNQVHIGVGVSLSYTRLRLQLARDTALSSGTDSIRGINSDCAGQPCGFENPQARQDLDLTVSTQGVSGFFDVPGNIGLVLGGLYRRRPGSWSVALAIVAPPGAFTALPLRGSASVTNAPRDGGQTIAGDAEIDVRAAESVQIGGRLPLGRELDLHISGRWQNTSRYKRYDLRTIGTTLETSEVPEWIPRYRGFRDTYSLSGGVERKLDFPFRYGARLRVERGAVKRARLTPIQIEGWNATAGLGVEWRATQAIALSATYDFTWFPSRTTGAGAFNPNEAVACVDSGYDFATCEASREGRGTPTAAGTYGRTDHGLVLSLRYDSL